MLYFYYVREFGDGDHPYDLGAVWLARFFVARFSGCVGFDTQYSEMHDRWLRRGA
jgi:hypothetical protein